MAKLRLYYPVNPYSLNQGFGVNKDYYASLNIGLNNGHNGFDMQAHDGEVVRAAHDGEVTFTGEDGSGGLGVVIRTMDKFDYLGDQSFFKTIYWHIKKDSFRVKAGQKVKAGDVVALADNTGLSMGSHLHFGLKPVKKGEFDWQWYNLEPSNGFAGAIDPGPYLCGISAESQAFKNLPSTLIPIAKLFIKMFNL